MLVWHNQTKALQYNTVYNFWLNDPFKNNGSIMHNNNYKPTKTMNIFMNNEREQNAKHLFNI